MVARRAADAASTPVWTTPLSAPPCEAGAGSAQSGWYLEWRSSPWQLTRRGSDAPRSTDSMGGSDESSAFREFWMWPNIHSTTSRISISSHFARGAMRAAACLRHTSMRDTAAIWSANCQPWLPRSSSPSTVHPRMPRSATSAKRLHAPRSSTTRAGVTTTPGGKRRWLCLLSDSPRRWSHEGTPQTRLGPNNGG
jgi:hypothetical protein